jgi:hypothetical protein
LVVELVERLLVGLVGLLPPLQTFLVKLLALLGIYQTQL